MKSPLFNEKGLTGLALQMKIMADLTKMHKQFNDGIEKLGEYAKTVHETAQGVKEHMSRIENLPPGAPGPEGKPGNNTPEKGVHYFTESDKAELIGRIMRQLPPPKDGTTPKRGVHYFTKDDVEHIVKIVNASIVMPTVDHQELIEKVTKKVKGSITTKDVKGFEDAHAVLRNFMARGSLHGAGDTVTAGTNVTITTDANGKKVISATSGSTTALTPTGAVDASNTTYTVASRPSSVVADGITYFENAGYTYAALQIVMTNAPSQYIRYYA